MKLARSCSADDVSVRLCFFVNVRKARGLKAAGGRSIGNTDGLDDAVDLEIRTGWSGVLKAGDEEAIEFGRAILVVGRDGGDVRKLGVAFCVRIVSPIVP